MYWNVFEPTSRTSGAWRPTSPPRSTSLSNLPAHALKYHTLLVAPLLDNYCAGNEFVDLRLIADPAREVIPFRTVFDGERFAFGSDIEADGRPSARLGSWMWRPWASAWNCVTALPLYTGHDKYDMALDANLRRMQSWTTALQYIEDSAEWNSVEDGDSASPAKIADGLHRPPLQRLEERHLARPRPTPRSRDARGGVS